MAVGADRSLNDEDLDEDLGDEWSDDDYGVAGAPVSGQSGGSAKPE